MWPNRWALCCCPPFPSRIVRRRRAPIAGTIDIAEHTLAAYVEDVIAGVFAMDIRGVLVLNAHDGNIRPVQTAGDRLAARYPEQFLLMVNWWETLAAADMEARGLFSQDGGHGHGGPLEMSAADAARPGTVDWGAANDLDVIFSPGERIVRGVNEGRPLPNWQGYHGRSTEGVAREGRFAAGHRCGADRQADSGLA